MNLEPEETADLLLLVVPRMVAAVKGSTVPWSDARKLAKRVRELAQELESQLMGKP